MFNSKKKSHISIELRDYIIRALVVKGPDFEHSQLFEIPLKNGTIVESIIEDEMALFDIFKKYTSKWGGKKQNVRLFVPDTSVLLKTFEHPEDVDSDKLLEYVQMELGESIRVPFEDPLVDVYDHVPHDGQAVIFAAPSDEISKLTSLFLDIKMEPEVADIRSLCNLRILDKIGYLDEERTYLVADWSINELSICIYSLGQVEFLRFQTIETDLHKWASTVESEQEVQFSLQGDPQSYLMQVMDEVLELDRMMNFFRYSLHKGEKGVDEIIVMGDNPFLEQITETLNNNLVVPSKMVTDEVIAKHFPNFKGKHAALLGLALKEVHP
ncbi:type IV pilus biogenesis protein PilM [Lysinibacillus endophyticus]|uniref:type IV pilus biogenesis protein PilM n=1 Tax=Ureibacillus endophyticus TaxID=1978490 RepID=UPI0020A12099|nr:pilus assembly protein PilM [Lysinibacillus endophyticus]MCP1144180.1 pilus assembly protein PilM [Lysinibacillus endophyticus]